MNKKKISFKKIFMVAVLMFVFCIVLYPYLDENKAEDAYLEPEVRTFIETVSISGLIVDGAGYFYDANSSIYKLLQIIELQDKNGINAETFDPAIESALLNIQKAQDTYTKLVEKAENTPYNYYVLDKLKNFPYNEFQIINRLNKVVFGEVEVFLKAGNVTGIFRKNVEQLSTINKLLVNLKNEININKDASIATAWELQESIADMSIFGSYVARVFKEID
jgi:hypothetical protein